MADHFVSDFPQIGIQDQFLVALVYQIMGRIREIAFQVYQQNSPFPPIAAIMPMKLIHNPLELPMKALSLLAGPVVINHTGAI